MAHRGRRARGRPVAVALAGVAALVAGQPAVADHQTVVTPVTGSAFGYHADDISLFDGAQPDTEPTPVVTLAPDASGSPQTATAETGVVQYGPATIFSSDDITVHTEAALGAEGQVTSSTEINDINQAETQAATGSEIFTADQVTSTCTANATGTSASTTVTNGTLRTHAQGEDHDEAVVTIPTNPEPNHKVAGHVHLGDVQDNFVLVFNEQIVNPDGTITVNAVHEHFGATLDDQGNIVDDPDSILQGDLYLGRSVCGVTLQPGEHPAGGEAGESPGPTAGGDLTYTVTVENVGTEPAPDTVLTATLTPEGFGVVSATPSAGTCDIEATSPSCALGTVAAGDTVTVSFTVRPPDDPEATQVTFTAEASFAGTDPDPSNNSDSEATSLD